MPPCGKSPEDPAQYTHDRAMAETQPPCARAELKSGDSVLDEVEKNSFIASPGRGDIAGSCPGKLCVPTREDVVRSSQQRVRAGLLVKVRMRAGPAPL